jgi:hypothetical protein
MGKMKRGGIVLLCGILLFSLLTIALVLAEEHQNEKERETNSEWEGFRRMFRRIIMNFITLEGRIERLENFAVITQEYFDRNTHWVQEMKEEIIVIDERVTHLEEQKDADIKYVRMEDQECTTNQDEQEIGWCPDDVKTAFGIYDQDFTIDSIIIPQVALEFKDPHVIKRMHGNVNAVSFDSNEAVIIRIVCPNTPSDGTQLMYSLINPKRE